jgi:carbon-monoxide dehydrogenase large subunit
MSEFKGRREDDRLLTGKGCYSADWNLAGQLYGYFLRSDRAHAEIVSLKKPEGVVVFTGEDTAHCKTEPPLVKYLGRGGMKILQPHRDVLARGRVRHVGQEIALVVAESLAAAQDAAERIEIEWRDLPVVVDSGEALAKGAPLLHEDVPGNLSFDFEYGNEGAVKEAFDRAAHVTRIALDSTRLAGNPMEPKAALAAFDSKNGIHTLHAPTQGLSLIRGGLAAVLGVPADKVRVQARDVGGGFGVRSDQYAEYCALMIAAQKLGRPVKGVSTRGETILSDHHGRAAELTGELALDRDGNFLALRVDWLVNAGAYLSHPGPLINTMLPGFHVTNLYRIPAAYGRHRLALTNTTPTTAYRGAGRPNVSYLVERLVDEAARETGADRIELRRRNLIPKEAFPYQTPHPAAKYDSGDPHLLLETALTNSGWKAFQGRREEARKRGKLRGIGCGVFVEPAGAGGSPKEEVEIRFGDSGNADIFALAGPSGQGHETVYPEVAAEVLGIAPEKLTLRASDPDGPALVGDGTIGSRSMMAYGGAVAAAAREVVKKGMDLAARELEVAVADLEFSAGQYRVTGTDRQISMTSLIQKHGEKLNSRGEVPQPHSFPTGVHIAEVEIDPETSELAVLRYVAVDDCGRVINHTLLEGQLHGGIVQGLGQAMGEHCVYDSSGQLLTGTFMDYYMPRADEQPDMQLADRSIPSPNNPLGVKGAGEAGTTGALPTIANAVIDALRPAGVHHLDFPFSPSRLWKRINRP